MIVSAKKNVLLLALCQALAMTGNTILFTVAALIGYSLATDKSLATLPLALLQVATMITTIPASLLMKRVGRKLGFMLGVGIGLVAAGTAVYALNEGSFSLFSVATILFGVFNGFVGYYRFAAAEAASEEFRAQAIALVIAGGVVAAVFGTQLATLSKDWFQPTFEGSMIAIMILQISSFFLLFGIDLPRWKEDRDGGKGRSLFLIMRQPVFIVAVLGSMIGYGVMVLVMTVTPLSIVAGNHPFHAAANVLQWHVLGMFAPSFITGTLIVRFGLLNIILTGAILSLLSLGINLHNTSLPHYNIALTVLGIGWNFLFIGSTTLLTQAYTPNEQAKTQAAHDFLMYAFVAFSTFLSGRIFSVFGWAVVNQVGIIPISLVLISVIWLRLYKDKNSKIV